MLRVKQEALTFDDVLLQPAYSEVTARDVSIKTRLSRNIELNIPLLFTNFEPKSHPFRYQIWF